MVVSNLYPNHLLYKKQILFSILLKPKQLKPHLCYVIYNVETELHLVMELSRTYHMNMGIEAAFFLLVNQQLSIRNQK